jgi:hypothetical protein
VNEQANSGAVENEKRHEPPRGGRFLARATRFWISDDWAAAWGLTAAFLFFLYASFYARYAANAWNKYFFDAL